MDTKSTVFRRADDGRARSPAPLEPFYYLVNFETVLSSILARYPDLLRADELRFIVEFSQMPQVSRALLARMVMRRGVLFRASKLRYREIGDPQLAAVPLVEAGWLSDQPVLAFDRLQKLFTKAELIRGCGLPLRYASWRKTTLVSALGAQFRRPRTIDDWCPCVAESVYALLVAPICERFRLLFFGNDIQTWTEFVTADLKVFRYEPIDQRLYSRPFQTRAHIDVFERLQDCSDWLDAGMPLEDLKRWMPERVKDSSWLEDRRQQMLFAIAREHERAGALEAAVSMYRECTHRGSLTRAARLMYRMRLWEEGRVLCLARLHTPDSEAERQQIRRLLPRLNRKLGLPVDNLAAAPVIPSLEILLNGGPGDGCVEHQVRDHLARELLDRGTIRYVENALINSLFGLLCWPAIFAPVRGAFFHRFHHGPADLCSGQFYERRKQEFTECLSALESGLFRRLIWSTFEQKWGIQSPFVSWHHLDKDLLRWALDCIPAPHLRLWFEWIIRDVQDNRAGFPDLVQFWPIRREYRMIEVKGPGDRLQDNQRRLLDYCVAHQLPAVVCYTRWRL